MGVQDRGRAPLGHELRWCRHYLNAALTVSNRYADPSNCFTEASTRRHQNGLRIDPVSSAARVPPLFQFVLEPSERVRARSRGFPAAVRQGRAQRLDDCGARHRIRPETGRFSDSMWHCPTGPMERHASMAERDVIRATSQSTARYRRAAFGAATPSATSVNEQDVAISVSLRRRRAARGLRRPGARLARFAAGAEYQPSVTVARSQVPAHPADHTWSAARPVRDGSSVPESECDA